MFSKVPFTPQAPRGTVRVWGLDGRDGGFGAGEVFVRNNSPPSPEVSLPPAFAGDSRRRDKKRLPMDVGFALLWLHHIAEGQARHWDTRDLPTLHQALSRLQGRFARGKGKSDCLGLETKSPSVICDDTAEQPAFQRNLRGMVVRKNAVDISHAPQKRRKGALTRSHRASFTEIAEEGCSIQGIASPDGIWRRGKGHRSEFTSLYQMPKPPENTGGLDMHSEQAPGIEQGHQFIPF